MYSMYIYWLNRIYSTYCGLLVNHPDLLWRRWLYSRRSFRYSCGQLSGSNAHQSLRTISRHCIQCMRSESHWTDVLSNDIQAPCDQLTNMMTTPYLMLISLSSWHCVLQVSSWSRQIHPLVAYSRPIMLDPSIISFAVARTAEVHMTWTQVIRFRFKIWYSQRISFQPRYCGDVSIVDRLYKMYVTSQSTQQELITTCLIWKISHEKSEMKNGKNNNIWDSLS